MDESRTNFVGMLFGQDQLVGDEGHSQSRSQMEHAVFDWAVAQSTGAGSG